MATTDPRPPGTRPTRVAKPKRGSETAVDMVRSLGLIAVIVAVTLIFVPALLHPGKKDKVPPLDYSNYVEGFHSLTNQTPLVPTPVPTGWHANSADLKGPQRAEHLRIGFVTPDAKYVGLIQSVGTPPTVVRTLLGADAGAPTGMVQINGASWAERRSSQHELALTRSIGHLTVMVTGSGSSQQLQALAASLR